MSEEKIAIVLGRGVEGCGVTKNVVEMMKYYPNARVYATKDKTWPRTAAMKLERRNFIAADRADVDAVAREINETCTKTVVFSLPSTSHPAAAVENFIHLLRSVNTPKSIVQVDHNSTSIARNARLKEVCESVDVLMTHSLHGSFASWCKKNEVSTPMVTMGVGFDYDTHRARWWKPVSEQSDVTLRWIGRCALWKGPIEAIELHQKYLRAEGFITVLEGIEASIQSLYVTHEDGFEWSKKREHAIKFKLPPPDLPSKPRDVIEFIRGSKKSKAKYSMGTEKPGDPAYLYPDYKNEECMERLSRSAFGSDLYNLKPEYYGDNIEYCHAEVVACGTVPLFHKHFGDHVIHRVTGDPCTKSDSGTLWYDPRNPGAVAAEMVKLSRDRAARDAARERAFEFWRAHSDGRKIYADIVEKTVGGKKSTTTTMTRFFD